MKKTKKRPNGWEDISDVLTHKAMMELKTGQILRFEKGDYRIMRMTPYKCWVKQVKLYHPDQVGVGDKQSL